MKCVMVQREMEKPGLGDKVECTWGQMGPICRLRANPEGERQGGLVPPRFGLGPWVGARGGSPRSPILRPGRPSSERRRSLRATTRGRSDCWPACLPRRLAPSPRLIPLAVTLGEDRPVATGQLVRRGDEADRAVQADRVVMGYELRDESPGVLPAQRRLDSDAFPREGLGPPLDL